jgi:hypothetical protein
MTTTMPIFATFWAGSRISAYEAACLSSFSRLGYQMTVYSYAPIDNLPAGVSSRSALEIVDERYMSAFLIKGVPSLSHFSDLFRYRLFQTTDAIWVDSDMYLLREFETELPSTLLARESEDELCGAIMRLSRADQALARLVKRTEAVAGRELVWGATGPRLLTEVFGSRVLKASFGPETFFPVHYDEFWKVFLPRYRDECAELCRRANTLHLWNNVVGKVGVWKDVLPPPGSYLHEQFVANGMTDLFQGVFPADVMENVIDNYRMRMSGAFGDITKLARLAIPGLRRRTLRRLDWVRDRI